MQLLAGVGILAQLWHSFLFVQVCRFPLVLPVGQSLLSALACTDSTLKSLNA